MRLYTLKTPYQLIHVKARRYIQSETQGQSGRPGLECGRRCTSSLTITMTSGVPDLLQLEKAKTVAFFCLQWNCFLILSGPLYTCAQALPLVYFSIHSGCMLPSDVIPQQGIEMQSQTWLEQQLQVSSRTSKLFKNLCFLKRSDFSLNSFFQKKSYKLNYVLVHFILNICMIKQQKQSFLAQFGIF